MRHIIASACVISFVAAAMQQQDVPRFRSGVNVVQFTVTVLDKDRHSVTGLNASDFEVVVDGTPRPLAAFAAVTLPEDRSLRRTRAESVAPDVQTNQLSPEGRLMVIVMDRSTPDGLAMQAARAIANAAIDRLGPADLGGVVFTAASLRKYSQGITADRARLHAAVNQIIVGALQEPPLPPTIAGAVAGRGAPQPGEPLRRVQLASDELSGECQCGVCVPDALAALASVLSGATARQKSILFIGSDIALAAQDPKGKCAAYIYPARERVTRALDAANVTFHVVDPRGLEGLGDTAELAAPGGHTDQAANLFRQSNLAILPDYTGGRVVLNGNTPADLIGPILDEGRAYYVLAVARDTAARGSEDRRHVTITVNGATRSYARGLCTTPRIRMRAGNRNRTKPLPHWPSFCREPIFHCK
jgi:VWFA-related protein